MYATCRVITFVYRCNVAYLKNEWESRYAGEKTIFLRGWMETPRKNGRPPSGTRRLSREMMLGALIKWRLPYPAKEAARKKKWKKKKNRRSPFACGEWKAFELRYACNTDLSHRYCPRTSYLRTTCNKYRHSSFRVFYLHRLARCVRYLFLFLDFFLINHSGAVDSLVFNSDSSTCLSRRINLNSFFIDYRINCKIRNEIL